MSNQNTIWKLDSGLCRDILLAREFCVDRGIIAPRIEQAGYHHERRPRFKISRPYACPSRLTGFKIQDTHCSPRRCISCDATCTRVTMPCAMLCRSLRSFPTRIVPCAVVRCCLRSYPTLLCLWCGLCAFSFVLPCCASTGYLFGAQLPFCRLPL